MRLLISVFLFLSLSASGQWTDTIQKLTAVRDGLIFQVDELNDQMKELNYHLTKTDSIITSMKVAYVKEQLKSASIRSLCLRGAEVREGPSVTENSLLTVKDPVECIVIGYKNPYFKVDVWGLEGWVIASKIDKGPELQLMRKVDEQIKKQNALLKKQREEERKRLAREQELRKRRMELEKNAQLQQKKKAEREARILSMYGEATAQRIFRHEYWLGMTESQALYSLGFPSEINRSVGIWGEKEQWVYGSGWYLYFENGILTSYQQ